MLRRHRSQPRLAAGVDGAALHNARPGRRLTRTRGAAVVAAAALLAAACSTEEPPAPPTVEGTTTTTAAAAAPADTAAPEIASPCTDPAAEDLGDGLVQLDGVVYEVTADACVPRSDGPEDTPLEDQLEDMESAAGTVGSEDPRDESPDAADESAGAGRWEEVCVGEVCVDMPDDGWPVVPDEVIEQPEVIETDHGHTHDEPEPTTSTVAPEPEPEPTTSTVAPEPEPEPEPELKPLPPRPDESLCPEGTTLTSYQRKDYSTWYCQRPIPAQVGETVRWPLPPDTEHPSYQQAPTSWLSHPMDIWVGMVFHNPDYEWRGYSGISGIVVDIVLIEEFALPLEGTPYYLSTPIYYVHVCWGQPSNFENAIETYVDGFTYWDVNDDGRHWPYYQVTENQLFRMEVDNYIPAWPCIAEGL